MSRLLLTATVCCLLLRTAWSQCDLTNRKEDVEFPDIETEGVESYQMSVEYTVPGAEQTDYYVEFYDILFRRGKIESHQAGTSSQYVYKTASWEAWEISKDKCSLQNLTETPKLYKDDQTDWLHVPKDKEKGYTVGPSAMFKIALDVWNKKDRKIMAYMGAADKPVRGLDAQFWRRCDGDNSFVDYYFTADSDESPWGLEGLKRLPLRVFFGGKRGGKDASMATQQYEIMSFQPYISLDLQPFQLPVGLGCKRGYVEDAPEAPDYTGKNLMFSAEAIYRSFDKTGAARKYWSYYSTLRLAIDVSNQHIAYFYTPWAESDPDEPTVAAPVNVIFDYKHGYAYSMSMETGECTITRERAFVPQYELPRNAGSISLTDPSVLFPNDEFVFITESTNRGLKVNVFEEIVENYMLNKKDGSIATIPKAYISHSYLQDDEIERNRISEKNALVQARLRFEGRDQSYEVLTFNFYGFSTELYNRRNIFNIRRCFKNDDDYVWVTLGFNADQDKVQKVSTDVPSIQANVVNEIYLKSELNAVRIPVVEVDMKDGIFVTLLILQKPPIQLDFLDPEEGTTIEGTNEVEGVKPFEDCALNCLETETNCWGFSLCGGVCKYGLSTNPNAKPSKQKDCKLYRRYNNDTFIPSMELMVENLRSQVQNNEFKLMLRDKDDNMVELEASSIEVTYPGEDDKVFRRIGNELNPRLRVLKAGYKLKGGESIKDMGSLNYGDCQKLCLDYKECESVSYCLNDKSCVISQTYADDIKDDEILADNMCNLLGRKYADHFDRSPGNVLTVTAQEVLDLNNVESCARACLTNNNFKCLSFDHCPTEEKASCKLHTLHYPNSKTREPVQTKSTNCGHYFRKFSTEFKKSLNKRTVGSKVPPLSNTTLEECSKACIDYGKGACFGFDFCQGSKLMATTCTLLDSDPSQMKSAYSPSCNNYLRTEPQYAPRPYSTAYTGGIGFLVFLIGGLVGAGAVFGIAYMKVNRR